MLLWEERRRICAVFLLRVVCLCTHKTRDFSMMKCYANSSWSRILLGLLRWSENGNFLYRPTMKSSSINMEIWKLSKLTIKSQFDSWCVGHTSLSSVECAQEVIAYLQTIHLMWWTWLLPKKWSNKWRRKCFNIYHFWFIHRWVNININNKYNRKLKMFNNLPFENAKMFSSTSSHSHH